MKGREEQLENIILEECLYEGSKEREGDPRLRDDFFFLNNVSYDGVFA